MDFATGLGVSNFTQEQLQHLIGVSKTVPAVNQVQYLTDF